MTIITDMLAKLGSRALGPAIFGAKRLVGSLGGPVGTVASAGDGRADNSLSDVNGLTDAYRNQREFNRTPNGIVARDFAALGQPQAPQSPMADAMGAPAPFPMAEGPQAQAAGPVRVPITGGTQEAPPQGVPMPMARPQEAPQMPADVGWFLRNAYNQRDNQTGDQIDPQMAAQYEARNPFAGLFKG